MSYNLFYLKRNKKFVKKENIIGTEMVKSGTFRLATGLLQHKKIVQSIENNLFASYDFIVTVYQN